MTTKGIPDGYGGEVRLVVRPLEMAGEGSRGGNITGHTATGKPIYGTKERHAQLERLYGPRKDWRDPHPIYENGNSDTKLQPPQDHREFLRSQSADKHVAQARQHMAARNNVRRDPASGTATGKRKHAFDFHQSMHDAHMSAAHLLNSADTRMIDATEHHLKVANVAADKFHAPMSEDERQHLRMTTPMHPGKAHWDGPMEKATRFVVRARLHEVMEKAAAVEIHGARTNHLPARFLATQKVRRKDARGIVVEGDLEYDGYRGHYTRAERAPLGVLTIEGHEVGLPFHMVIGDWADAPRMMEMALRTFAQGKFPDEGVFSANTAKPKWGVTQ